MDPSPKRLLSVGTWSKYVSRGALTQGIRLLLHVMGQGQVSKLCKGPNWCPFSFPLNPNPKVDPVVWHEARCLNSTSDGLLRSHPLCVHACPVSAWKLGSGRKWDRIFVVGSTSPKQLNWRSGGILRHLLANKAKGAHA